jgi:hypothetical protein
MYRVIASVAICTALLAACDSQPLSHEDKQVLASVQVLRDLLGKPEGLKIMHADQYSDGAICYTFRARNGFGGFSDDVAVYDGGDRVALASIHADSYAKHCLGHKPMRDVTDYANYGLGL